MLLFSWIPHLNKEENHMKPSKRLSALLLALCLIVSLIAPAVYAEEESQTVTYDFDFVGIVRSLGKEPESNALNAEKCQLQISALKEAEKINWCYRDISFTNTATNCPNFTVDRYFRGRAVVGDWVALSIDNPGEGTWKLDLEYVVTYCGAQQVDAYILPGSVTDIAGSLTSDYLVGSYSCYDSAVGSDTPTGDKVIYKNTELSQWTAGSVEENPTYTLVLQSKTENSSNRPAVGVTGKLAANIYFSKLTMTEVGTEEPEGTPEETPEEGFKDTVYYNFDLQGLYKELGVELEGNNLLANDKCKNQLNTVNETHAEVMNWNFKDIDFPMEISAKACFISSGFQKTRR